MSEISSRRQSNQNNSVWDSIRCFRGVRSEQKPKTEQKKLFFCRERKNWHEDFLRLQRGTVCVYYRALDTDKGVFRVETGKCDAVSGGKSGTDDLMCLYQLCDSGSRVSGQKKRAAAAGNPMGQQCAAAGTVEGQKIPMEAAQSFRCIRDADCAGQE